MPQHPFDLPSALGRRRGFLAAAVALCVARPVLAQVGSRLSITTGGPGGVYLPLGEGMAQLLSKYLPGCSVTAQATQGSVDNLQRIGAGKAELGFTMVDAAWQAAMGTDQFRNKPAEARTLLVLYPNRMQIVTMEGSGVRRLSDLRGKRVATGAAGSGVEVMALRVLEAAGILDPATAVQRSTRRGRGGHRTEGAPHRRVLLGRRRAHGGHCPACACAGRTAAAHRPRRGDHCAQPQVRPLYMKGIIAPGTYAGVDKPVDNIDVWNLLVTDAKLPDQLAYDIVKTLIENKPELEAMHKEAQNIDLRYQKIGSPIPYHPGARRYFEERGVRF